MKLTRKLERLGIAAPDVNIVDEDVVEVAALLVAEEGVRHPHLIHLGFISDQILFFLL